MTVGLMMENRAQSKVHATSHPVWAQHLLTLQMIDLVYQPLRLKPQLILTSHLAPNMSNTNCKGFHYEKGRLCN